MKKRHLFFAPPPPLVTRGAIYEQPLMKRYLFFCPFSPICSALPVPAASSGAANFGCHSAAAASTRLASFAKRDRRRSAEFAFKLADVTAVSFELYLL